MYHTVSLVLEGKWSNGPQNYRLLGLFLFEQTQKISRVFSPEIGLCQSGHAGPAFDADRRLLDVYREKPVRLTVRIAVPVKEHPKVKL